MRCRNVKPSFFKHEGLGELHPLDRILFLGLFALADSEGRLLDRPKRIKADILPYDDHDVDAALSRLEKVDLTPSLPGLIVRYSVGDIACIWIPNFKKHQALSTWEKSQPSEVPACSEPPGFIQYQQHNSQTTEELQESDCSTTTDTHDEGRRTKDEHESDEGRSVSTALVLTDDSGQTKKRKDDGWKRIKLIEKDGRFAFDGITEEDRAEWQSLSPDIDIDRELIKVLNREGTHPQWFAKCKKGGRWVATLKTWMMNAQSYVKQRSSAATSPVRIPAVDYHATQRAAEREWQKIIKCCVTGNKDTIRAAHGCLCDRTVDCLRQFNPNTEYAMLELNATDPRLVEVQKRQFVSAWVASEVPFTQESW